jgi:hypothetical protein
VVELHGKRIRVSPAFQGKEQTLYPLDCPFYVIALDEGRIGLDVEKADQGILVVDKDSFLI